MGELQRLFGATPRVKSLEAILRLRGMQFSRPDLAAEADIHKPSAYRVASHLIDEGILMEVSKGVLEVNEGSWRVPALYRIGLELGHHERMYDLAAQGDALPRRELTLEWTLDSTGQDVQLLETTESTVVQNSSRQALLVPSP